MRRFQLLIALFLGLAPMIFHPCYAHAKVKMLKFISSRGWHIVVDRGVIQLNGKELYRFKYDDIIYDSKRNKLIEDGGSVFLFLEIDGRPNLDRIYAFRLVECKAELLADAISSDLKDLDGDSYLEFGGSDLTEMHPSEDSMYYIPHNYYEIRFGDIKYDSALSKKVDRKVNGIYLAHPADEATGYCCKVIVKPGLKKVRLVDPPNISERIDGPANVRDAINGRLLFVLNDNTRVGTTDTANGWLRVGLTVDLTKDQYASKKIVRGAVLYRDGLRVGKASEDLSMEGVFMSDSRAKGILTGYTRVQNIKLETQPENVLSRMIGQPSWDNIGMASLKDFIAGFGLSKGKIGSCTTYTLDQRKLDVNLAPLRLVLVFNGEELFAVVHSRKMNLGGTSIHMLKRGYVLSVIASPGLGYTDAFIKDFNKWVSLAD